MSTCTSACPAVGTRQASRRSRSWTMRRARATTASATISTPRSACRSLTPSWRSRRRLPVASCGVVSGGPPVVLLSDEVERAAVHPRDHQPAVVQRVVDVGGVQSDRAAPHREAPPRASCACTATSRCTTCRATPPVDRLAIRGEMRCGHLVRGIQGYPASWPPSARIAARARRARSDPWRRCGGAARRRRPRGCSAATRCGATWARKPSTVGIVAPGRATIAAHTSSPLGIGQPDHADLGDRRMGEEDASTSTGAIHSPPTGSPRNGGR